MIAEERVQEVVWIITRGRGGIERIETGREREVNAPGGTKVGYAVLQLFPEPQDFAEILHA